MPTNIQASFSVENKVDMKYITGYFHHNGSIEQVISDKAQFGISLYLINDETSGDLVVKQLKMSHPFSVDDIFKSVNSDTLKHILNEFQDTVRGYYRNRLTTLFNRLLVGKKTTNDLAVYFKTKADNIKKVC